MPNDEDSLFQSLRDLVARNDPVPQEVTDAALGAFAWRNIDAELAQLTNDSLEDQPELAIRSGEFSPRLLTFEAPGITIDLESTGIRDERRVVGQLIPEQAARLEIRHRSGVRSVEADEYGRFSSGGLAAGPVSFVVRIGPEGQGTAVKTDWVIL